MNLLKKDILSRVYLVYVLVSLFAIVLIGQTINIQIFQGSKWIEKSKELTIGYKNIEAVRGNIYADDGSLLATSVPKYEVRFDVNTNGLTDKIFNQKVDSLSKQLANLFKDKSSAQYLRELKSARKNGERFYLIRRNVKYTNLKELKNFPIFRKGRYKGGLIYTQQNKRVRPFNQLAARTIGYEREGIKPVGLEGAYSKDLSGINGRQLMQKIAGGVWMPIDDDNEKDPEQGHDVYSTLDVNIQDVAENTLMMQLKKHQADHGCVVLMEVSTGEIKAIANLKRNDDSTYSENYNYAIGESTEPGSVFKLASLIAAFEDGYIELGDLVDTENGSTKYYDRTMRDSHSKGFGVISVQRAFEVSSNVGISKIIYKYYANKPKQFVDRICNMGLNKKLGIEIAGEANPIIKNTEDPTWSGTTLPWMSIGYEVKLTPLQILTFYNAVANNGVMVKPKFVKEITKRGAVIKENKTIVLNNSICSKSTLEKVKKMLEGVVEEGTAENLKNTTYKIAGKTGTAQIADEKYGYKIKSKVSHQASFVGYFPADNPKYSCIVVVNAPSQNVYYGNLVAGPIFKEVADKVYANSIDIHHEINEQPNLAQSRIPYSKNGYSNDLLSIYKTLNMKVENPKNISEWIKTSTNNDAVSIYNEKIPPIYVPNVVGMGVRDAVYILENEGFEVQINGEGTVKKQSILPGEKIEKGQKIILELA